MNDMLILIVVLLLVVAWLVNRWVRRQSIGTDHQTTMSAHTPSAPTLTDLQLPPDMQARLQELLARRQKIEAIKLLRAQTGWGLKEAKAYVDGLTTSAGSMSHPPAMNEKTGDAGGVRDVPAAVAAEVRDLLAQRRKIEAVKRVREQTGWGLKEAKEYVDDIYSSLP